jgi:hypothetical protein
MAKTYTAAATATAGEVYTASAHNVIVTDVNNLIVPPFVKCVRSGDLSYTNTSDIAWNAEAYDTDSMHDNVTNNTRITPTTAGIYVFTFSAYFTFSGTSTYVNMAVKKNNADFVQRFVNVSRTSLHRDHISFVDVANGTTDYYTANIDLGGGSSISLKDNVGTFFSATWIGQTA